jgi:hypothetical protein
MTTPEQIQMWARESDIEDAYFAQPHPCVMERLQRFAELARADLVAEVEQVRADRDGLYKEWESAFGEVRAEVESLRKDAERYRWLRDVSNTTTSHAPTATLQNGAGWQVRYEFCGDRFKPYMTYRMEELDVAIDTAMKDAQ